MKISKEGFDYSFDPKACETCAGNCCIGESGYIWVDRQKAKEIADFLGIKIEEFSQNYLKKVQYRFSLKEIEYNGGYRCVFFNLEKRACTIYPVRPKQCASFPFWEYFKKNIKELEDECPGITRL
ncbi:YkgJ family cysteine cluster protein [Sulfurospirillum sp. 1612]|uniref:YkgJ family cysteine cluster protein n=1 Tax=Sulfurospirillum sp. 1612 TaxID=3094835 RepID=UPI002F91DBF5